MEIELTGSLNNPIIVNNQTTQTIAKPFENIENIKEILREVEDILETSIKQKIKMARYVDKLLKHKSRLYAEENINLNK